MNTLKSLSGSERRFVAFCAALIVITLSGLLKVTDAALAALVTLTLGYVGQGAAKEVAVSNRK